MGNRSFQERFTNTGQSLMNSLFILLLSMFVMWLGIIYGMRAFPYYPPIAMTDFLNIQHRYINYALVGCTIGTLLGYFFFHP